MRGVVLVMVVMTACGRIAFDPRADSVAIAVDTIDPGDHFYPDFTTCPADLVLVDQAMCTGGVLQLTLDQQQSVAGCVWFADTYSTSTSVSIEAVVDMATTGLPADGLAFVLHADPRGTTTRGLSSAGLGYAGITPSIAFEIDEYANPPEETEQHVAIHADGQWDNALVMVGAPFPLGDGVPFTVWVDYDATTGQFGGSIGRAAKPVPAMASIPQDLTRLGPTMWIGITAATGNEGSTHRVLSLRVDAMP